MAGEYSQQGEFRKVSRTCLSPKGEFRRNLEKLTLLAGQLTRQRFGRTIQMFAPLYLSNECIDVCQYCGFSLLNQIQRKTLSPEEVLHEAEYLIGQGFRHLLLVSGEHPKIISQKYLEEIAKILKPRVASLAIEVAPFQEPVYRELIQSGIDRVVIYQETYDRRRYGEVHLAGPKKNYERRLLAPEEAARAGIRSIGMGILVGLADWRSDLKLLMDHVRSLKKRFWQTEFTISFPRLRPCASGYQAPFPVSDEEYLEMICSARIALPDVGIVLSTRESPALRNQLIGIGVTHMSAGSHTNPGGYTLFANTTSREDLAMPVRTAISGGTGGKSAQLPPAPSTTPQFEIEDSRSPQEVAETIRVKGYEPVWKDWENIL